MNGSRPMIEILMATYNGEAYLREQLDSILEQGCVRWHLTISDDASTDTTPQIIDEYVMRYPEKVARYRSNMRFGSAKAHFFHLMESCSAPYFAFCDQDDVWYKEKLERTMSAMLEAEKRRSARTPVLVFSDQTVTDEQLRVISPSLMRYQKQYFERFDYRSILLQNVVTGGAMMINRALAQLALQCADTSQVIMHDWWMAAAAARFGEIVYIDEPLGAYRQHGHNSVGAKDVGSLRHVAYKLRHLEEIRYTISQKKEQADVFAQTFSEQLDDEDDEFLRGFAKARSGPWFYVKNRRLIHGCCRLAGMMLLG